ncbi:TPA: 50S ribosomal protein L5 [Candidatus Woesearchaeota archaeon]|nr:large subunit ribosomal protein L5 [uncultured archaeon]KHO51226.1 MAG: large subunit ribosomal protein L5 [archaeon GW2011_AR11]HII64452.1 50S ribosomal protein L5 [Candidatus Woesearchaeota archaeon]HIJ19220.1 50S ribosomal protein L5 [Candidatus Woesearchaeota archaeon]
MTGMRDVRIEKVTLNIGCGKDQSRLDKAVELLKSVSGATPVKTFTQKRIQEWGLRPGLPIGCKVTLRGEAATEMLKRLLDAKDFRLQESQFDDNGNISFGIHEYIDIPGAKYDPKIGIMGLQACITLERPGFRIKRRKVFCKRLPKRQRITRKEAIDFMAKSFSIKMGENK